MKILVTGSTGFIGGALCRALAARGDEVLAFHRASSDLRALEGLDVTHMLGDLTQPETLAAALPGVDAVFHTAALLGGGKPERMAAVTVEGTRAVLQAAQAAGVRRVVHTSSVAALGVPEGSPGRSLADVHVRLDEHHTWNYIPARWPYGYAKYRAELEVQQAVASGLDAVIVNPSVVFGAGDVYRQTSSLVVQVARQRLPGLVDGGLNAVHIDDVVAGHLAALERGRTGERYILGGQNLTHAELVRVIAVIAGVPAPAAVFPVGVVQRALPLLRLLSPFSNFPIELELLQQAGYYFYYDTAKARSELGLSDPRPVEEAVRDAYDWFTQVGAI